MAGGVGWRMTVGLGLTQTVGYGTLYYTLGVTAPALSADLGVPVERLFLWFSVSLFIGGLAAPRFGRWLDRAGARRTMTLGTLGASAALAGMSFAQGEVSYALAVLAAEVVATLVLYDAAFAAVVQSAGREGRRTITHITLIAGFASTVFWPLTAWLLEFVAWRDIYLLYAGLHLAICLPVHALLFPRGRPKVAHAAEPGAAGETVAPAPRVFWLLALAFAATAYVVGAIPAQMVPMLRSGGFGDAALWLGSLMGPAQVAIRVVEATVMQRFTPVLVAVVAASLPPLAVTILLLGAPHVGAGIAFAIVFGAGSGLNSIVRGTLPLALFGPAGYGALLGRLAAVSRSTAAFAPFAFAALTERLGLAAALLSGIAAGLAGLFALLVLRRHRR